MKRFSFAIFTLLVFATAAWAQQTVGSGGDIRFVPPLQEEHLFNMTGTELTKGTFDQMDDKIWGNIYVVANSGEKLSGQLTLSVDYVSGIPDFLSGNRITGATWTMALFQDGQYAGNVYGTVTNGTLRWKTGRSSSSDVGYDKGYLDAKFLITGGSGAYEFVTGGGGTLSMTTNFALPKPVSTATLKLTF